MSQAELDRLIGRIQKEFSTWGAGTTIPAMRESWDRLFADVRDRAPAKRSVVSARGVPAEWLGAPRARPGPPALFPPRRGDALGGGEPPPARIAPPSGAPPRPPAPRHPAPRPGTPP